MGHLFLSDTTRSRSLSSMTFNHHSPQQGICYDPPSGIASPTNRGEIQPPAYLACSTGTDPAIYLSIYRTLTLLHFFSPSVVLVVLGVGYGGVRVFPFNFLVLDE